MSGRQLGSSAARFGNDRGRPPPQEPPQNSEPDDQPGNHPHPPASPRGSLSKALIDPMPNPIQLLGRGFHDRRESLPEWAALKGHAGAPVLAAARGEPGEVEPRAWRA